MIEQAQRELDQLRTDVQLYMGLNGFDEGWASKVTALYILQVTIEPVNVIYTIISGQHITTTTDYRYARQILADILEQHANAFDDVSPRTAAFPNLDDLLAGVS